MEVRFMRYFGQQVWCTCTHVCNVDSDPTAPTLLTVKLS